MKEERVKEGVYGLPSLVTVPEFFGANATKCLGLNGPSRNPGPWTVNSQQQSSFISQVYDLIFEQIFWVDRVRSGDELEYEERDGGKKCSWSSGKNQRWC